ncbi:hypothetical protein SEA_JUBIE_102 [Mycobacterium phage Jubie]|nr:hypothetical protein SEA_CLAUTASTROPHE_101 [Mycobacterium phage Clautastrophe]QDF16685.1 hypothetical protein PBI_MSGREEN_103 [Mycobacterium phage MsGreen]QPL14985.1 hypothetical protein SEA_JUBIE_102 [Mycobacterium phage Jubie]
MPDQFMADCCVADHGMCDPCCLCGEPEGINERPDLAPPSNPIPARVKRKINNPWPTERKGWG